MPIPIQISDISSRINIKPGKCTNGYNGNLNMWDYGLNENFKEKIIKQYNSVGQLAQYETVNSPYYIQAGINQEYINFLQNISLCKKKDN